MAKKEGFAPQAYACYHAALHSLPLPYGRFSSTGCASSRVRILHIYCQEKNHLTVVYFLAEKEGFEPSRPFSSPTPLAGEPLRPYLGTSPYMLSSFFKSYALILSLILPSDHRALRLHSKWLCRSGLSDYGILLSDPCKARFRSVF